MKKFISMVMAAAMVVSLVPATAFAKSSTGRVAAKAQIVDALELTKTDATANKYIANNHSSNDTATRYQGIVPELKLTITDADYRNTNVTPAEIIADVTLTLDNAEFLSTSEQYLKDLVTYYEDDNSHEPFGTPAGGATTTPASWSASNSGTAVIDKTKSDTAAGIYEVVLKESDFNVKSAANALVYNVEKSAAANGGTPSPNVFTIAADPGVDIKLTKTGETDVVIVANGGTTITKTPAEVVALLKDGWTFVDTAVTNHLKYDSTNVVDLSVTAATQFVDKITADYSDAKYERGNYTPASTTGGGTNTVQVEIKEASKDEVTYRFKGCFTKDFYLIFDLESVLDKTSEGKKATVSVSGDLVNADDLTYVSILGQGISASTKKLANVAEEEKVNLEKDLKIKSNVGDFEIGQKFTIKTSKGFEFTKATSSSSADYTLTRVDDNEYELVFNGVKGVKADEFTVLADDIEIEATSAKSDAVCVLTIKAVKTDGVAGSFTASTTVDVAKVVDYKVVLSVDEDEDIPEIYSGVNVENHGITDDSDHMSLEVTAEETFPGAWSMRKGFSFELPEGVHVTNVDVTSTENFVTTKGDDKAEADTQEWYDAFWNAYQEGSHLNFEFEKRVFDDVNTSLEEDPATVTFQLELVADPTFEGDVVLKLTGDLVDEQEVTIAKFVKPYTVKAEQNDLIIDYRYTDIPTAITITEPVAGLWAKNDATFRFEVEKNDYIVFEDDPTFEIDKDSELEIKDDKVNNAGQIQFTVKSESDEAATVTIKDMQLFMQRSIPAGPYDLKIGSTLEDKFLEQILFAPEDTTASYDVVVSALPADGAKDAPDMDAVTLKAASLRDGDNIVDDIDDYSSTVKEAFVNVVTSGRDKDDASFTTKVVVPIGESKMFSGEKEIALDVPAYINAAGYTMMPVRAVAVALGIDNDAVQWDSATKTVIIMYGQRVITMTAGQKVVYASGTAIPAKSAVEIKDGRAFLGLRDLATALGVTDVSYDAATKTATLNGNQK